MRVHSLVASLALWTGAAVTSSSTPVPLIVDTDIGGGGCKDVDDVAALCMAHALADNGEADLLAVLQNTSPEPCAGVIGVINTCKLNACTSPPPAVHHLLCTS